MLVYYFTDKYGNLIFDEEKKENREYLGSIERETLEENFFCNNQKGKQIRVNENNELYWGDPIIYEPSENDLWLQIDEEQRNDKAFLFSKLKYKFLDDDPSKGIDSTKPLIEIDNEVLTCDECLTKILQYTYDVGQSKKKTEYINARKKAKEYIREKIGSNEESSEDNEATEE